MTRQRILAPTPLDEAEERATWDLRPTHLAEYVGQRATVEKLRIALAAAKQRAEPLEHMLVYGPPGLGKTTLAHVLAREMGAALVATSGPALVRTGDLLGILTNLAEGDVLFIDEVHRLATVVEEFVYPAMEDFHVDLVIDKGPFAKSIKMPLKRFTLIGATTRAGLLSSPLRNRFGMLHHIGFYAQDELVEILRRSAGLLGVPLSDDAAGQIACRARGTPRVANRLLRRVRDFAQVRGDGRVTAGVAVEALAMEGVDEHGLDDLDRRFLRALIQYYNGGPVGVEALSATLNEEVVTLVDMVEPYLLTAGLLARTRHGRKATQRAWEIVGGPGPAGSPTQKGMF